MDTIIKILNPSINYSRKSLKYIVMKKSSLLLKVSLSIIGLGFAGILVWANWESKGYTQSHVADSEFAVYDVSGFNNQQHINLEKQISCITGVSSCSYNSAKKFIGVIFYTSKISSLELQDQISQSLGIKAIETEAPQQKNGCPVGGLKYFILHIKHVLNFRS
jgi:hypothetical protein